MSLLLRGAAKSRMISSTQTVYVTLLFHSLNKHPHQFALFDLAANSFFLEAGVASVATSAESF